MSDFKKQLCYDKNRESKVVLTENINFKHFNSIISNDC